VQLDGRFALGVGSGEALNEHILGDPWPSAGQRLEMLEEAVHLIRLLHKGEQVSFRGEHYRVQDAQIWTLPEQPVPIYVSGFGLAAASFHASANPDSDLVELFRKNGGAGKPVQGGMKVCCTPSEEEGVQTAARLWSNELLPGQLAQTLPRPQDFADASSLVPRDAVAGQFACGPDPERHLAAVQPYLDAGFDEIYVQIGPDQDAFFRGSAEHVLPALSAA